jgi:3-hydroxy acid dehydrogenase/malonic semialdehyde reductase
MGTRETPLPQAQLMEDSMPVANLNGIEIAYDEAGEGDRAVLFVHGHPFDRSMWGPQMEALAECGWRLLAPDLRGYGGSGSNGAVNLLGAFASDLAALLDHLEVREVVLCGLSMGGQIVMEFCRLYPGRASGIVLAATFPQAETEAGKQSRHAMADRLLREGMSGYAGETLGKMVGATTIARRPDVAEFVLRMMQNAPPAGAAAALRGRAQRPDYADVLAGLGVPALVVVGDEDAFTPRADAERMRDLIPDARLLWMPGVGHMPNLERPERFNTAVAQLLGRLDARPLSTLGAVTTLPRTVLVTGASAGFGAAISRTFAASGARVIVCGRRTERLEALAAAFPAGRVLARTVDITDVAKVADLVDALPPEFAEIDLLVNNAGLALGLGPAQQADLSDWDRMIDTNCRGLVHMTRAVAPRMSASGRGHIVNIGSVAGDFPYPGGNVYGATKAFVRQFSQNLRSDLHGSDVRVSCIEPGICGGTEFSSVRLNGDEARAAGVYAGMSPLTAEDIADAVFWVATRPAHVNVNRLEVMPVAQSWAPFQVHRT